MEVKTIVLVDMDLANPKSQSLTIPLAEIKIFCGFISLWMILCEWR